MTGTHDTDVHVKKLQDLPPFDGNADLPIVSVHGRFVRKRNLSKGLVFGDIQLQDGELLEVMIRAQDGVLDVATIRQINWDVHLGDLVTARGLLECKRHESGHPRGWLFVLHTIQVEELWSLHHEGAVFSCTDPSSALTISSGTVTSAAAKGSYTLPPSSKAGATNKYTNMVVLDGFNACKYYFSSSGGANCLRGEQCHFWHGRPKDFKENRRRWIAKRLEQRAKAAHITGDSADPHSKLDKAQRSRIFCEWLVESLGEQRLASGTGVIDVAGGKGDIPIQLWIQRGIPTTLIDPRPMKLGKRNRKLVAKAEAAQGRKVSSQLLRCLDDETLKLHTELFSDCSVLVGMHPDEATEAIVDAAITLDRQCRDGTPVNTYETFVAYLLEKHPSIQSEFLPFAGRNQVLYRFYYEHDANVESVEPASS